MSGNSNGPRCFRLDILMPGPDRKRTAKAYHFRLTHRRADQQSPGCLMTWEVEGGRSSYQIALERKNDGSLHIHCTCADAVFRGDLPGHRCKHIEGFLQAGELVPATDVIWRASA
jgi:hypothetical protein